MCTGPLYLGSQLSKLGLILDRNPDTVLQQILTALPPKEMATSPSPLASMATIWLRPKSSHLDDCNSSQWSPASTLSPPVYSPDSSKITKMSIVSCLPLVYMLQWLP